VQADPIIQNTFKPKSLNRFSYVLNNPINLIDPSGNEWTCSGISQCEDWVDAILERLRSSGSFGRRLIETFEEYVKTIDIHIRITRGASIPGAGAWARGCCLVVVQYYMESKNYPSIATLAILAHELIHLLDGSSIPNIFAEVDAYLGMFRILQDLGFDWGSYVGKAWSWIKDIAVYVRKRGGLEKLTDDDLETLRQKMHEGCPGCGYDDYEYLRDPEGNYNINFDHEEFVNPAPTTPTPTPPKEYVAL
jgi:hypothetical protein